jgi:18S rRNA (adenine1779-N6/adenine1780-N6)-dimethyltransferase
MPKAAPKVQMGIIGPDSIAVAGGKKLRFGTRVLTSGVLGKSPPAKARAETAAAGTAAGSKALRRGGAVAGAKSNSTMFNKGHGQHILKNPLVVAAIVEKAGIKSTDVVIEIGPGTGNLTEKLLMAAKKVIAYEIDPRMVAELHKRFQHSPLYAKLEIVRGNCLDSEFPYFDRCVANVPYAISSALVFKLLRHQPAFKTAVLMFQREFALRVCAPPGSELYGRLGVNAQLLARCSHLMKVSKNSFVPPPKVESSVIRLDPRSPPPPIDFAEWDGLVKLLFNRKNKKATASFRTKATAEALRVLYDRHGALDRPGAPPVTPEAFAALLANVVDDCGVLLDRRARTFTIDEITQLLAAFNERGIHFS